jgi:hypothetical protein
MVQVRIWSSNFSPKTFFFTVYRFYANVALKILLKYSCAPYTKLDFGNKHIIVLSQPLLQQKTDAAASTSYSTIGWFPLLRQALPT